MKFLRIESKPSKYQDFKEKWIQEDVDRVLGKLVVDDTPKIGASSNIYRCIGFCSALDEISGDYYYILYDGLNDQILLYSAVGNVELLENRTDKKEYIEFLEKIKKESADLKIIDIAERRRFRNQHIKKCVEGHIQFSIYNHKLFWDLD